MKGRAIRAAEIYDRKHKPKGARNGPLGHVALEVYRALWGRVRFSDGCLCPSIEWLMAACRRSRAAVVGALKRLHSAKLLSWLRRMEYTDAPAGERGPQARQCTNAYRLEFPRWVEALAPARAPLIPADALQAGVERGRQVRAFEREAFNQSSMGLAFDKAIRVVQERESAKRSPSALRIPSVSAPAAGGGRKG